MIKISFFINDSAVTTALCKTDAEFKTSFANALQGYYRAVRRFMTVAEFTEYTKMYLNGSGENRGLAIYDDMLNLDYYLLIEQVAEIDLVAYEVNKAIRKDYAKRKRASRSKVVVKAKDLM